MYKKYFLLFFFLLCLSYFSKDAVKAFPNEPDGFRGIKWEADLGDVSGLECEEPTFSEKIILGEDNVRCHSFKDRLELFTYPISQPVYTFYKNKLSNVSFEFDPSYYYGFLTKLIEIYGNPDREETLKTPREITLAVWKPGNFARVSIMSYKSKTYTNKGKEIITETGRFEMNSIVMELYEKIDFIKKNQKENTQKQEL